MPRSHKKIAVVQSCYIPWKGYFDLINMVDEFILYDDVQYTRRDWRNRNIIKTPAGLQLLTIPVNVKGKYYQAINDTTVANPNWAKKHWTTLTYNYAAAAYFKEYKDFVADIYDECANQPYLSKINFIFLKKICYLLEIKTKITSTVDYQFSDLKKTERLIHLCQQANATHYISGPSAKDYIDTGLFADANIQLEYIDYTGYPIYPQLFGNFEHNVTILDLLFNSGSSAKKYMKSFFSSHEVGQMSQQG